MEIRDMCKESHRVSKEHGFETHWLNVPEKLMLIVTELAEAMEAYRLLDSSTLYSLGDSKGTKISGALLDDEDERRVYKQADAVSNFKEELADTFIRLGDLCDGLGIDIESAIADKQKANEARPHLHGKQR